MMNAILQNLNYAAPYPGNVIRSIWAWEKACQDKYQMVYLFPYSAKNLYWINEMIKRGCKVYFKDDNGRNFKDVIIRIIDECNIKIIHTHFYSIKEYKILNKVLSNDVKLILHHRNHFMYTKPYTEKNKAYAVLKKIYRLYSKPHIKKIIDVGINVACSYGVEQELKEDKFSNVLCIENAIDFTRLDVEAKLDRKSLGISDDETVLLMFGFAFLRKGVDLALEAIEPIADMYNIKLCIVFSANEEQGTKSIYDLYGKVPEWIKILKPNDNVVDYYSISDIFLSPSREEGFCNAVVESVYCRCALIASDISGQDHVKDFPYVKMIKNGSVNELRNAIIEYSREPLSESQINDNRKYVFNRYSLDNLCSKIVALYDRVI